MLYSLLKLINIKIRKKNFNGQKIPPQVLSNGNSPGHSPPTSQTFCKQEGKGGCATLPLLGLPNHSVVCFWSSSTAWKSPKPCVPIKATVRVRTEILFVWYEYVLCINLFLIYSPAPHANQLPKKCQSKVELYKLSLGHFFLTKKADFSDSVFLLINTYPCSSVIILFIRH